MYRIILLSLVLVLPQPLSADSSIQTDWTDGSGFWGPVTAFNSYYYYSNRIDNTISGSLCLAEDIVYHTVDSTFNGVHCACFTDIDDDGYLDILSAASYDPITWWRNVDSTGQVFSPTVLPASVGYNSAHSNDMDNDGDLDVIACAWYAKRICWWENSDGIGTLWTLHVIDSNYNSAQSAQSHDIDGDGDLDVLASSFYDDSCNWWENIDGLGTSWLKHTIDGYAHGIRSVYPVDLDGDGDIDVIGALQADYDIVWWENSDGTGTAWVRHCICSSFQMPWDVHPDDIDGDGDIDVVGAGYEVCWWENKTGSGTQWIEHLVVESYAAASCVNLEDMDGDNDIDVLVNTSNGPGSISWNENADGSGVTWINHYITNSISTSVSAGDVNADGDIDVVGSAYQEDLLIWCDLNGFSSGVLESSCLYLQNDPGWGNLTWTALEQPGTFVAFKVRSSDIPRYSSMGSWSDTLFTPCSLSGLLNEGDSYFQYRVLLQTENPEQTPFLEDVTITWDALGIPETESNTTELLTFNPNPCLDPTIRFYLGESSNVEFSIFEISGRPVRILNETYYPAGYYSIELEELSPGVYFCRMYFDNTSLTRRFVISR